VVVLIDEEVGRIDLIEPRGLSERTSPATGSHTDAGLTGRSDITARASIGTRTAVFSAVDAHFSKLFWPFERPAASKERQRSGAFR
jgi:hypothetical protein